MSYNSSIIYITYALKYTDACLESEQVVNITIEFISICVRTVPSLRSSTSINVELFFETRM